MSQTADYPTEDRAVLAAFVATVADDLDAVVELRERLFGPVSPEQEDARTELLYAMGAAWAEVRETVAPLVDQVLATDEETLQQVGLTGAQLMLKYLAWREARDALLAAFDDSDDPDPGPPPDPPAGERPELPTEQRLVRKLSRWKKWALKKLGQALAHADTILESLAGVVSLSEPIKEIKKTVEKVAEDTADGLPDEPG
jgi:hypothetical protein